MRFRTVHKAVSYAVAGLGILVLALGNILHPAVAIAAIAAAGASWWIEEPLISRPNYVRAWNIALAGLLVLQILRVIIGGSLIACGIEFALVLQVSRLWNRRTARQYQQIVVLSLVHLIASSVLDQGISFAVLFVGFILVLPWVMTLSHLRREIEGNYRRNEPEAQRAHVNRILNSRRIVGRQFLSTTAMLSLPVFLLSGVLFLFFPRVGLGFLAGGPRRRITVAGFSDQVQLGDLGVIRNDNTVVMRVEIDPAPADPPQRLGIHWRGTAYDHYDGRSWSRSPALDQRSQVRRSGERYCLVRRCSLRGARLTYQIYLENLDPPVILLPPGAAAIQMTPQRRAGRLIYRPLYRTPLMEVRRELDPTMVIHYQVETPPQPRVTFPVIEGDLRPYLQLPELDPAVAELTREVTAPANGDPYRSARAVAEHLRAEYRYSLDLRGTSNERPLEDFLLRRRSGHCEFFSTAMAIMLRQVGVPTRNVTGFLGGRLNRFGGEGAYYAVTQAEAHSWVEVYLEDVGWVTFDPTPPATRRDEDQTLLGLVRELIDAAELSWDKNVIAYDLERQFELLGGTYLRVRAVKHRIEERGVARGLRDSISGSWAIAVGLGLAVLAALAVALRQRKTEKRAQRRRRSPELIRASSLIASLDRTLSRRGYPRPPWRTPLEHAAWLKSRDHPASDLIRQVILRYNEIRFGGKTFGEDELEELRSKVREIGRAG